MRRVNVDRMRRYRTRTKQTEPSLWQEIEPWQGRIELADLCRGWGSLARRGGAR